MCDERHFYVYTIEDSSGKIYVQSSSREGIKEKIKQKTGKYLSNMDLDLIEFNSKYGYSTTLE
jgi:hypothetical protein